MTTENRASQQPRSVPPSVAAVLEELELAQPTLVTLSDLEKLAEAAGTRVQATTIAKRLRELGWLLPLRAPGVWEFAPGSRAGRIGRGDPFIEFRARLATRPLDAAVAVESAAWLLGLAGRIPSRQALSLPPGVRLPKSLDEYRVVRWSVEARLDHIDRLPVWSVNTLLTFMGSKPHRYHDWPNVPEWLRDGVIRAERDAVHSELAHRPRSAWARTCYLISRGGREEMAHELMDDAPHGSGPYHLGPRDRRSIYSDMFDVEDHLLEPTPP